MVRSVGRARRVVHEERLLGRVDVRVEDHLDRLVGQVLAEVVALLRRPRLRDRRVVLGQVGIPLVRLAAEEAVEALEPAAERPAVERPGRRVLLRRREVPLAEAERVVALLEQHLRQHAVLERHPAVVAGEAGGQLHDAGHAAASGGCGRSGCTSASASTARWCACSRSAGPARPRDRCWASRRGRRSSTAGRSRRRRARRRGRSARRPARAAAPARRGSTPRPSGRPCRESRAGLILLDTAHGRLLLVSLR